jgi:putative RNA 2'-phosphotransferase
MPNHPIDSRKLTGTMVRALRHSPDLYSLELSPDGWAKIEDLLVVLRMDRPQWGRLTWEDVEAAIREGQPGRFEIEGDRVRAAYGHTITIAPSREPSMPPGKLFHATDQEALADIRRVGLRPMGRQFVHLTEDMEYALRIARFKEKGAVLVVDAAAAVGEGVVFYRANEHVWLVAELEPRFMRPSGIGVDVTHQESAPEEAR